ncbi:hypothetical protein WS87_11000 [Burkholderia sp. MSMB0856]|nr:hypothetical protein WS87_11000 [Burkholderia sp. MSMB0856]KVH38869.1 hypothetical protein WS87_05200 [Burkholderia sp. MSMB0856]
MASLYASEVGQLTQRVAGRIERVTVRRRECGGAQCVADDFEARLRLLEACGCLGGHDVDSYVL